MRAGRRKQKSLRPRKEESRPATTAKAPHSPRQNEGTELPTIPSRTTMPVEDAEDVQEDVAEVGSDNLTSHTTEVVEKKDVPVVQEPPLSVHTISDQQREAELEAKTREARALVEERRAVLDQQELRRRQQEETRRRRKRRDRANRKKRTDHDTIDCSNKGPGSDSNDMSDSGEQSFEESSQEENPFELCYSPEKERAKPEPDVVSHKPNIVGYQSQDEPTKRVLIEDNYKGMDRWEPAQTTSSITSCWSGVVSQLCGSSQLWMNLPLVSMFAYDPVPDAQS